MHGVSTSIPARRTALAPPTLSIVVPAYDVAAYLPACLDSVLASHLDDLEVVCIDDGSTDASGAIADRYAAGDPRVRVLHQDNAGLGATRNRGAQLATGRYLGFLDSDDLVPPDAYAAMVAALEGSRADLVTGDIRRLTSVGLRPSPTFSPIYHPARSGTHVSRDHALLRDRIAPNKLYRRAFWQEHGLAFPTGVLHEDIPLVLRAHVLAREVEVLDRVVYHWRIRAGADRSITQRRLEERALIDRVAAVTDVSRFLASRGLAELKAAYDLLVLTDDLRLHARELDRADADYRQRFLAEAGGFLAQVDREVLDTAPVLERARWHLIGAGDVEGAAQLASAHRTAPHGRPARLTRRGRLRADLPLETVRTRVPRRLLRLDDEVELHTGVTALRIEGETLVVDGYAALSHGDVPTAADQKLRVWVEDIGEGTTLQVPLQARPEPAACRPAPAVHDREGGGFQARLPLGELTSRWTKGTTRWRFHAQVVRGALTRRGTIRGVAAGAARRVQAVDLGRLRVGPRLDQDALDVVVAARPVRLTAMSVEDGRLRLHLASRRSLTGLRVRAPGRDDVTVPIGAVSGDGDREAPDGGAVSVVLDAVGLARHLGVEAPSTALLHAVDDRGRTARLSVDHGVDEVYVAVVRAALGIDISRYAYAGLRCGPPLLHLDGVEVEPGRATVAARVVGADARRAGVALQARDRHDPLTPVVELVSDDRVRLHLDATAVTARPGSWELTASLSPPQRAPDRAAAPLEVRVRRSVLTTLPVELLGAPLPITLDDRSWHRPALEVGSDPATDVPSRGAQRRHWQHHTGQPAGLASPAPRVVDRDSTGVAADAAAGAASSGRHRARRPRRDLTTCLTVWARHGRGAGGDAAAVARAVHELDPQLPVRWIVDHRSIVPPDFATAVPLGSRAWVEALASSGAIVADTALPEWFVRASGQRVVRCWDGVPVRPIGALSPGVRGGELPADAARAWSHLVSAGPHASAVCEAAFGLQAGGVEVLLTGLPRHDVLDIPARRRARRAAARQALAVEDADRVVLHLPTWSDGDRHPGGTLRRTDDLDLDEIHSGVAAHRRRGEQGQLRVVVRSHPAVVDTFGEHADDAHILDVGARPDPVDLLLAADVVVAHPSSVVLEATRVGVPVVVYDPPGRALASSLGPPVTDLSATAQPLAVTDRVGLLVRALAEALDALDRPGPSPTAGDGKHLEVTGADAAETVARILLGR